MQELKNMSYPKEKEGLTTNAKIKKIWTEGKRYITTFTQKELSQHIQVAARPGSCGSPIRGLPSAPAPVGRIFANQ